MTPSEEYRCNQTIDLEEIIEMNEKHQYIKAIITYKSGREEAITGKLKADGTAYKTFNERIFQFKQFPTVVDVKTQTW